MLNKRSPTILTRRWLKALVILNPIREDDLNKRRGLLEVFPELYRRKLSVRSETVGGPFRFGDLGKETVCMQSTHQDDPEFLSMACIAFGGTWRVTFTGVYSERDEFFRILKSAKN
jgi:hypothetical protein